MSAVVAAKTRWVKGEKVKMQKSKCKTGKGFVAALPPIPGFDLCVLHFRFLLLVVEAATAVSAGFRWFFCWPVGAGFAVWRDGADFGMRVAKGSPTVARICELELLPVAITAVPHASGVQRWKLLSTLVPGRRQAEPFVPVARRF
jgi:hypothetical protein